MVTMWAVLLHLKYCPRLVLCCLMRLKDTILARSLWTQVPDNPLPLCRKVTVNSADQLLETPLHAWHVEHHGRMVDFAGWSMPVQYSSIMDEHHQTRNALGMFDVSHMGRLYFSGHAIDSFLDRLTTRRVAGVESGRIRYSLMANEAGGILDDVLVYHLVRS